ncbi:TPA: MFS transporter [Legionella pneumophila]|uniref:MFS transporter n=1 Tax=Legionella pneumophila TaxID=446 RepID=UPI000787846D|nr:MFS transporter [Legionella pneumophila]HAT4481967.1 MFS transporter [Legionella pneumophila]HAU0031623.1 MFS transporter [Legionella pneumophila]HAU0037734.1 MFS transporter [Legionella pneumophila]HAU0040817.1 MFS transporter [Legionella pneumophila]HAU0061660.1 MFS transporter [Legionella pneumophila]
MSRFKDKFSSGLGSVLEWYDFALYGFFAPLIAQLYFPSSSSNIGLLKAFSVFAIGFIARPIGALVFGSISDKYGRIASLKMTPILITLPTMIFSILPTYQEIGLFAPIILTILRIWQGICIGGEYTNNIVYLCETTNQSRTYFIGSIGSCTGSFGIFLASSIATIWYKIFSSQDLLGWGWRLAFALSSIFGIIVYFLRRNMKETPIFQSIINNNSCVKNPIFKSFQSNFKDYLLSFGLIFLPATSFYYVFMFLPNFLDDILKMKAGEVFGDNSLSLFLRLLIIPLLGLAADKIGGIKIARLSCVLFLFTSYPLFSLIANSSTKSGVFFFAFAMLTTLNAATTPGLLINLLKPETRCTMLSFTFNLCFGVFGGIVPIISLVLITQFDNKAAPIFYLMFAALITFITTFFCKRESIYANK